MAESEHPKGTQEDPLTRDDVLERQRKFLESCELRENEKRAVFDLSKKWFAPNLVFLKDDAQGNLTPVQFAGKIERNGMQFEWLTNFTGSHLPGACFNYSDLRWAWFREADLNGADFSDADLRQAVFVLADLRSAKLSNAKLGETDFSSCKLHGTLLAGANITEAKLEYADYSPDYKIGDEIASEWPRASVCERQTDLDNAANIYRRLKQWYTYHGMYDIAGEFFYREMECKRKGSSLLQNPGQWLWLNLLWGPLGYGEKPGRVVGYGILVWLLFAAAYLAAGVFGDLVIPDAWFALYLSAVSFTAVGYGPWIDKTYLIGWVQGLAAFESFVGVFMIAVFVTTFVRKMTR